jgi:release factor glutamine methyltransferase
MSAQTVWTIKALLNWTTDYLKSKGVESPRLEAQILLAHVMNVPKIELVARSDEEPSDEEKAEFKALVKRRVDGWPTAYLVGRKDFYLLSFEVTPAVLIPRPDTETLVEHALRFLKGKHAPRVLDLGTGSGCIAVSLAHQAKAAAVTAVDLSPDAATVAKRNADKHAVTPYSTAHGNRNRPRYRCARRTLCITHWPGDGGNDRRLPTATSLTPTW